MLGVEPSVVGDMEDGRLPPSRAPLALVRLAPDVDWQAVVLADGASACGRRFRED
jgi:hypothetical protein